MRLELDPVGRHLVPGEYPITAGGGSSVLEPAPVNLGVRADGVDEPQASSGGLGYLTPVLADLPADHTLQHHRPSRLEVAAQQAALQLIAQLRATLDPSGAVSFHRDSAGLEHVHQGIAGDHHCPEGTTECS